MRMNLFSKMLVLALGAGLMAMVPAADATVIDFNGGTVGQLSSTTPLVEDGYNILAEWGDPSSLVDLGGGNLALSEINNNSYYGSGISIALAEGGLFTLDSFWADDLWDSDATAWGVWVNGYQDGILVASKLVTPISADPQIYILAEFDNVELDTLSIGGHESWVDDFVIDNISLTEVEPVPEPATLMLLGGGLVGLAGAKRRKKK